MQLEHITLQKSLGPRRGKTVAGKKHSAIREFFKQLDLQILVIPAIIHIIIFAYIPMYGVLMAFQVYRMGDFPGASQWAANFGFEHFIRLFKDPNFPIVMRNTLVISLLKTLINFPMPIIFAVLLNEVRGKYFKKAAQTISYLPYFISWVVAAALLFDFFSVDGGAVNDALLRLGIVEKPIHFFGTGKYFWWMTVLTDLWKNLGWNSIIFIAAITSIDAELYEAAEIDGANRYQKIWHITIASIMPTIILLLVFNIGGLLNANFDQIMNLTNQMGNPMLREYANVIDTQVYIVGLRENRLSYGAAAGLFKSVVNIILLLLANKLASKTGNEVL